MKDLRKDLEAFDDAGAGAVEILIAFGDEDAGLARGPQVAPARAMRKERHVLEAVGDIKAARMHCREGRAMTTRCASQSISGRFSTSRCQPDDTARDHRAETDALNARIEQLRAELAKVEVEKRRIEVSAAGHRADFERERERCNTLMVGGSGPGQACNVCS